MQRFLLATVLFLFLSPMAYASGVLEAYALDTIAGVSTTLRSSEISPFSKVVFDVEKANKEIVHIPSTSNKNGVAYAELSNFHTRTAGDYRVSVRKESESRAERVTMFSVLADKVSQTKSSISPSDQVVPSGGSGEITVALYDQFSNPIEGHLLRLVASDPNSTIQSESSYSSEEGIVSFMVSSNDSSPISYSVYDVSADIVLTDRAKVAFWDNDFPDDYLYAAIGNSSGPIDHFEFESIPEEIAPADSVSFTITAYDANDVLVTDYEGTVRFSVTTDNYDMVSLPNDYSFSLTDQGSHTFSLSLSFQQIGEYDLEIRDIDNSSIFGEYSFLVEHFGPSVEPGSGVILNTPSPGTYSNNIQIVTGITQAGDKIKIFDNDVHLSSLVADINGSFSYTTPTLVDGEHTLYVAVVDDDGTILKTSEIIDFTIDTSAPEIAEILLIPSGEINAGSAVELQLHMMEALSQAAILLDDTIIDLEDTGAGYYLANFNAPLEPGEYSLDFILIDELGNESKFEDETTFTVVSGPEVVVPAVSSLVSVPTDSRITLNWTAPEDPFDPIAYYRVFYGTTPTVLAHAVDTFTNAPSWYLPNLQNGVQYYFAVAAVDVEGRISETLSNVSSAVPAPMIVEVEDPDVVHGVAGADALAEMESEVSNSGPELWILPIIALFAGFFLVNRRYLAEIYSRHF